MSSVTKRTAEIIFSTRNALIGGEPDKPLAEWAEDIKQAFVDDRWYHSPLVEYQMKRIESGELMTGQEWYGKFERNVQDIAYEAVKSNKEIDAAKFYIKAAKKAAGIK